MRYALTAEQMRAIEKRAVDEGLVTLSELMSRAGATLAAEVAERVPAGPVTVVCGSGNNGGDGWVAARLLRQRGRVCRVVAVTPPDRLSGEARDAANAALADAVRWEPLGPETSLAHEACVVDAVFGFGFHGEAREPHASALELIGASDAFVIATDIPSGISSDTGAAVDQAVRADVTVTFTALKPGLLLYPGAAHAGEVVVTDIGIPGEWPRLEDALEVPEAVDVRSIVPWPTPEDHKGSRGRVALITGSSKYPGAAVLATRGAMRLGPGFVVAVVPETIADIVRSSAPNILVRPVRADEEGAVASAEEVMAAIEDADAVVVGPGLTTGGAVAELVGRLLAELDVPLLLDADALNVLQAPPVPRRAPLLITPHPGEASRLLHSSSEDVQRDRMAASAALAHNGTTCLLKGARTLVSAEGRRAVIAAGNAGLARAGSGDVLSGMLGTLLAQGVPAYDAAVAGAFLHGRAAEYGTRELTETCFTSADIERFLPDAVREVAGE